MQQNWDWFAEICICEDKISSISVYTTIYVREAAFGKSLSQPVVPNVFVFLKYLWYDCTLFDQI